MSDGDGFEVGMLCGAVVISIVWVLSIFAFDTQDELREQAVNCGCAEWVVDARGGTEFVWKCEEPETEDE